MKYQTSNSNYRTYQFELKSDEPAKHELKTTSLKTNRNIPIQIRGQIDRLDVFKSRERDYVSIIDYKSSETSLDLTKVLYGKQMQMFTYLAVVLQNKELLNLSENVS